MAGVYFLTSTTPHDTLHLLPLEKRLVKELDGVVALFSIIHVLCTMGGKIATLVLNATLLLQQKLQQLK